MHPHFMAWEKNIAAYEKGLLTANTFINNAASLFEVVNAFAGSKAIATKLADATIKSSLWGLGSVPADTTGGILGREGIVIMNKMLWTTAEHILLAAPGALISITPATFVITIVPDSIKLFNDSFALYKVKRFTRQRYTNIAAQEYLLRLYVYQYSHDEIATQYGLNPSVSIPDVLDAITGDNSYHRKNAQQIVDDAMLLIEEVALIKIKEESSALPELVLTDDLNSITHSEECAQLSTLLPLSSQQPACPYAYESNFIREYGARLNA